MHYERNNRDFSHRNHYKFAEDISFAQDICQNVYYYLLLPTVTLTHIFSVITIKTNFILFSEANSFRKLDMARNGNHPFQT